MLPPGRLPSFDSLRCFLAAARQGNFRRAAREVGLTPAAFSQRIKQLEQTLEVELFDRSGPRVQLTAAGQALVPRATTTLAMLQQCADVGTSLGTSRVHLRLGTRYELGLSWVVPAIAEFRRTHPLWKIDLLFGSGPEILDALSHGRADAIITSAPASSTDWVTEVLHPERYVFVGSRALLERVPLDEPADAAHHVLLDIDSSLPLTRYLTSVSPGLSFKDVQHCGTGAAVRAFVLHECGVAVLPRTMVASALERGELVELLCDIELLDDTFRLLFRNGSPLRATLHEFAEVMRARPLT